MTPFMVKLTEAERATLESERARLGLRSMAEVIRHWIAEAPGNQLEAIGRGYGVPSAETIALSRASKPGSITYYDPFTGSPLTNAKGEPKELPKPRKAFKSRLKGEWKAP